MQPVELNAVLFSSIPSVPLRVLFETGDCVVEMDLPILLPNDNGPVNTCIDKSKNGQVD